MTHMVPPPSPPVGVSEGLCRLRRRQVRRLRVTKTTAPPLPGQRHLRVRSRQGAPNQLQEGPPIVRPNLPIMHIKPKSGVTVPGNVRLDCLKTTPTARRSLPLLEDQSHCLKSNPTAWRPILLLQDHSHCLKTNPICLGKLFLDTADYGVAGKTTQCQNRL